MSDNEIYLLIKYIKSVLWTVAKRLSYTEDARCLKVNGPYFWFCYALIFKKLSVYGIKVVTHGLLKCDVIPYDIQAQRFRRNLLPPPHPEHVRIRFLRHAATYLPDNTASHPRKSQS